MWQILASVGILGAEYIYSHWIDPPKPPLPASVITIPLATQGSPIPLIFGRCRVTAPVLAYTSSPVDEPRAPQTLYQIDLFFILGIGFGGGGSRILQMYIGDTRMRQFSGGAFLKDQQGNGNFEDLGVHLALETPFDAILTTQGSVEFLNGNPSQTLINPGSGAATTHAGQYMTTTDLLDVIDDQPWNHAVGATPPMQVPGYRGYLSAFLWAKNETVHWAVGVTPQVSAYSFEVTSYPVGFGLSPSGSDDCNAIDIILEILTGTFAKLGEDLSYIDMPSFVAAANTLTNEFFGISAAMQQQDTVGSVLAKIFEHIDGGLFEDPTTGKLKIKLNRADYDPATTQVIDPTNCVELKNFAASGWTDIVNRVVVKFTDRANTYQPGTAIASSIANAVGQDGEVREVTLDLPWIMDLSTAQMVADRELQARSKPMMKCRAIVNRSFLRTMPGDVKKLVWPEANIAGIYFRVANVGRGTLENPNIMLDLVQDTFYVHRLHPPVPPISSTSGTFTDSF